MVDEGCGVADNGTDIETLRHYIDKVERAWVNTATSQSRLLTVNILLAVVLGALGLGVVSVEEKVEIQGLSFSLPLTSLLIACAAGSLAVTTLYWATWNRTGMLGSEIVRLYRQAGFEVPAGDASNRNPWSSASPMETAVSGDEVSPSRALKAVDYFRNLWVIHSARTPTNSRAGNRVRA